MISKIIGDRLKFIRNKKALSQEELANICGLDRTYIIYIETAKKNVTVATLYKITKALGITLSDFFKFDETNIEVVVNNKVINTTLIVGDIYTNEELFNIFNCATQGGMRVSNKNKTVTLINNESPNANPYKDSVIKIDGSFVFTGMGLKGDQLVTNTNQNGKVANSNHNGYELHYFILTERNKYLYKGQAFLNGDYYFVDEPDSDGVLRKVVKFPLILKDNI